MSRSPRASTGRLEKARAEMVPVDELAELLAERHGGWGEGDFEQAEGDGEPPVSDAAWARVMTEKRAELAHLATHGVLQGRGAGKRLRVNAGSFYDWLGEDAPVYPDCGLKFDIRPDTEAQEVERLRQAREQAREALMRSPSAINLARELVPKGAASASWGDELVEVLEGRLREGAGQRWQELVAVETVLSEVAAEFDGEDPLEPDVREMLVGVRAELEELFAEMDKRLEGHKRKGDAGEEFLSPLREAVFG